MYSHHHESLAIEQLQIRVSTKVIRKVGPQDAQRESELQEIEKSILKGAQNSDQRFKLVDDSIRSAILSRGLDRPRIETDGRLAKAERMAERFGTSGQRLECAYEKARTAFWWYEDYAGLSEIYEKADLLACGSTNPHDLERLRSLWFLLHCAVFRNKLPAAAVQFSSRTEALRAQLKLVSQDSNMPSAALHASLATGGRSRYGQNGGQSR